MDRDEFEAELRRDGFDDIIIAGTPAGYRADKHAHDFELRALMLAGEYTLKVAGERRTYRPGEVFTMAVGCPHEEQAGPVGASFVMGKKA